MSKTSRVKDPRPEVSDLFSHLMHTSRDLANPVDMPGELSKLGWMQFQATDGEEPFNITVNLDQVGRLLSTSSLTKNEARAVSKELALACIRRDRVAFAYTLFFLQSSKSVDGKLLKEIKELMTGATQKISQNVQQHKLRRILTGGKNKESQEEGYTSRPNYGEEY